MSSAYKQDEKAPKKIIYSNVTPTDPDAKLNFVICYRSEKTPTLLMKNSCFPPTSQLQKVNVIFQHICFVAEYSHLKSLYI